MSKEKLTIEFERVGFDDLTTTEQELVAQARAAAKNAYAPYSHFQVGAALLLADGAIHTGNNQENSAYPSGLCAERTVLFATSANKPDMRVVTLVITAKKEEAETFQAVTPCGACRQVMTEYMDKQSAPYQVILEAGNQQFIKVKDVRDLLPFTFSKDQL
ncbi:cytidine deaminase [Persicobacter psychrovividus]|uniref:Cytidine deaminase n=1 Tax=Persicobacter psychrovividus TaxID=387638 RepID=A0ABM7VF50_9BACT|nr:cytidine deaminase [Persicobacter psychrovividus]